MRYFGIIGESIQHVWEASGEPGDPWIEMSGPRPNPTDVATEDGEWVETPPVVNPPHLNNSSLARFTGYPVVVKESIRVMSVSRLSAGRWRIYFSEEMPTTEYSAFPSVKNSIPATIRITGRTIDFVEVRVSDLLDNAYDADEVSVLIERVVE